MKRIIFAIIVTLVLVPLCVVALSPPHDSTNSMDCNKCHKVHPSTKAAIGTPVGNENLCRSCHNPTGSSDAEVHAHADKSYENCTTCHSVHDQEQAANGSAYGKYVSSTILTPNSGVKSVVFKGPTGPNSFADGDSNYNGICEVCHTKTAYHRNNASGDHTHYAGQNCADCHPHTAGFNMVTSPRGCLDCHSVAVGTGGNRRQVVKGAVGSGDFTRTSHHVGTGSAQTVTEADCKVCHDLSAHRTVSDGTTCRLNNPDGGAAINYDGTGASLDPFCKGCHDANGAGGNTHPLSDGKTPSDIAFGTRYSSSIHTARGLTCSGSGVSGGCHANGHGSMKKSMLAPDNLVANPTTHYEEEEGFCIACHPTIATETKKLRNHNITSSAMAGRHDQYETLVAASYSSTKRHAECADCHSPHWLQSVPARTMGSNLGRGGIKYVARVTGLYNSSSPWAAPTFVTKSSRDTTSVVREYELCFKCHASWAFGSTPPTTPEGTVETDVSVEFNPYNKSFHPVVGQISTNSYTIPTATNGNIQTMNAPFDTTSHKTMYCSDCHKSDNASAPKGPHGSNYNYLLPTSDTEKGLCLICHKASVYNPSVSPGTAETGSRWDRQTTGSSYDSHYNHVTQRGYTCRACHGGVRTLPTSGGKAIEVGSLHGTNTVPGMMNGRNIKAYSPGSCTPTCHGTMTYTAGPE